MAVSLGFKVSGAVCTCTAKNERFPKFASTGNLTGNLMFQGVRYLRMCVIPITFPEKLGNVYGNVLGCCI